MKKKNSFFSKMKQLYVIAFWVLLWFLLALRVGNSLLLAGPAEVLKNLGLFMMKGSFWLRIGRSLFSVFFGLFGGLVLALVFGRLSLKHKMLEELLHPIVLLCKAVPVASFVVLFLIWWGSENLPFAICITVSFPLFYTGFMDGMRAVPRDMQEMADLYRVTGMRRFMYVERPVVGDHMTTALSLAAGMSMKAVVAAELIGTPKNTIGEGIYLSKIYLDTGEVLTWTLTVLLLGWLLERGLLLLHRLFLSWQPAIHKRGEEKHPGRRGLLRVELQEVTKTYGDETVLTRVSSVYEGDSQHVLRQPSGFGKTTLLRCMAGLEEWQEGSIRFLDADGNPMHPLVSFDFQEDRLCESVNAIKNVALVTGDEEGAKDALQRLLPSEALQKPVSQLSGGMRRRVCLVRALEYDSDLLLLDEPFTGMDEQTKQEAKLYLKERRGDRICVIASHD